MRKVILLLLLALSVPAMPPAPVLPPLPPAGTNAPVAPRVRLAWDPSPSPGIAGYRVYWGPAAGFYTNTLWTTNLTAVITNPGLPTFFSVTANDTNGLESDFCPAVEWPIPIVITVEVKIQTSTNLTHWVPKTNLHVLTLTNHYPFCTIPEFYKASPTIRSKLLEMTGSKEPFP